MITMPTTIRATKGTAASTPKTITKTIKTTNDLPLPLDCLFE